MIAAAAVRALGFGADPLDPDADEARRWLLDELSKPRYRAAEPNALDVFAQAVRDWFTDLLNGAGAVPGEVVALLVVLLVIVLVVVGLLVFGVPRLRRRRASSSAAAFEGDLRDAGTIRRAAEAAARDRDWPLAIEERFRAIVRDLVERELVQVHPGTTARGVADAAARPFPDARARLADAADAFDDVRYLGAAGDAPTYERLTTLDRELQAMRPVREGASTTDAADGRFEAVR
ncbi:DUF4129 domain-containing protein [Agromyces aureus]|uniref:Protein-glutamine gamma-glutamyltransferase-like C-terminal domain-containing protein n=1 Tax=Agromyces aureus TaxID=453304 RepID=A0A191WHJ2_9MICO|nr:DUF4129 domain-containing protein [Agromyces aureus]ANJ27649.1 hypothetical protein ATC03_13965 [Agromyces aureus]